MTDREAMTLALKALDALYINDYSGYEISKHDAHIVDDAITALRQALEQPEQSEVTVLPDGSAFGVMSYPLPKTHWIFAEREYADGQHEPIELGNPILTYELRDAVVSAVRYAIRGATNCGKEMDFDPDALVQNAVYALCGPYRKSPSQSDDAAWAKHLKEPMSEKRVHKSDTIVPSDYSGKAGDYSGKAGDYTEQEPVAWMYVNRDGECEQIEFGTAFDDPSVTLLYTAPPGREWVGLTDDEISEVLINSPASEHIRSNLFARAIEAKLKEKNHD